MNTDPSEARTGEEIADREVQSADHIPHSALRTPHSTVPPRRPGYQDFFDAAWVGSIFRPLLIALVAASVVGGPLAMLHLFAPSWRLGYALPFAFAVALEGVYSTLQLGRPAWRDRRGLVYRLGEILILLALFRVVVWTFGTGWPGLAAVQTWLRQPAAFLDAQFVFLGIWMVIAWGLAVGMTGDFLDLALQPDEIAAHDSPLWGESRSQLRIGRATPRSDILTRFVTRWTVGGILLVFFASLSQVDLSLLASGTLRLGISGLGLPPELLLALICYFLAGLLLISQGRLAVFARALVQSGYRGAAGRAAALACEQPARRAVDRRSRRVPADGDDELALGRARSGAGPGDAAGLSAAVPAHRAPGAAPLAAPAPDAIWSSRPPRPWPPPRRSPPRPRWPAGSPIGWAARALVAHRRADRPLLRAYLSGHAWYVARPAG